MALPAAPGSPTNPSALPVVGQGGAPGQPPVGGAGGATMPTPNRGVQAAANGKLTWVARQLLDVMKMLEIGSDQMKDINKAFDLVSKHVPPGSGSPGVEQTAMHKMMLEQKSEQPMLQLMRQQGGAPGGGGAPPPGGAGGAAPPAAAA